MNKDDMSDDEQFDAFLKGEDELSRRLQAMAQPEPPPELDAAIMKRVRFAHAQRGREAANDPVVPEPRLAAGSSKRWRIPVGIAASVLAGVFATQVYESDRARRDMEMDTRAEEAAMITLPQAEPAAAPPSQPAAAAPAELEVRNQAPQPAAVAADAAPARSPAPGAPALRAKKADAPGLPVAIPAPATAPPPPVPAPVAGAVSAQVQQPEAAPVAAPAPVVAPAPKPVVNITGQAPLRRAAESVSPVAAGASSEALKPADAKLARVEVTGSRIRTALAPAPWLDKIEQLLKADKNAEALAEWKNFRMEYPDYEVPPAIANKLKEVSR